MLEFQNDKEKEVWIAAITGIATCAIERADVNNRFAKLSSNFADMIVEEFRLRTPKPPIRPISHVRCDN